MVLVFAAPSYGLGFQIFLTIVVYCFYCWLFYTPISLDVPRNRVIEGKKPDGLYPEIPASDDEEVVTEPADDIPANLGIVDLGMTNAERLPSSPIESPAIEQGIEQGIEFPGIDESLDIEYPAKEEPVDIDPGAIATIRQLALRKCDIDPTDPSADKWLSHWLNCIGAPDKPCTVSDYNEVYTHWGTYIKAAKAREAARSGGPSKEERQAADSEAIRNRQQRQNFHQYRQLSIS